MKKLILIIVLGLGVTFAQGQVVNGSGQNMSKSTPNNGSMIKRTMIQTTQLKKTILDNVKMDYPGYTILEAYKVSDPNNKMAAYQVQVLKGTEKTNLYYDKDGMFLSKEAVVTSPMTTPNKTY